MGSKVGPPRSKVVGAQAYTQHRVTDLTKCLQAELQESVTHRLRSVNMFTLLAHVINELATMACSAALDRGSSFVTISR